jgi:hypothetical protein
VCVERLEENDFRGEGGKNWRATITIQKGTTLKCINNHRNSLL